MKYIYALVIFSLLANNLHAQYLQARLEEDTRISVRPIDVEIPQIKSSDATQLPNFPKAFVANQSFKNFRNVTLADLDGDGADDIIVGINDQLYAIAHDQTLWEYELEGVATFPPSVADVDNDGELEIALATWGVAPASGHLYLVDQEGSSLPNWPIDFAGNFVLNAPVLSDLDADGQFEIIACERSTPIGFLHVFNVKGVTWSENWPVLLDATPAVTPSVGDLDGDGTKEIVAFSTQSEYVFNLNGDVASGWPVVLDDKKHSYQSPILANMDEDENSLEIIGAAHGDAPEFFIRNNAGEYLPNWPKPTGNSSWTFSPPTILQGEGSNIALMSQPSGSEASDMLYAWTGTGDLLRDFPISKVGGLEGVIALADLDGDGSTEMIFGSNLFDQTTGTSFLHAYKMDGSGELEGFPLRPRGWTFLNGASLGDVNGDNFLDIVALSYTQNFGTASDSVYINAYPTDIPYETANIQWATYKGSNTREGVIAPPMLSGVQDIEAATSFNLVPNPASEHVRIHLNNVPDLAGTIQVVNILGQTMMELPFGKGTTSLGINVSTFERGLYFLRLQVEGQTLSVKRLLVQ